MYSIAVFILKLFPRLTRTGADARQISLIVRYKLLMDNRKSGNAGNTSKESNYSLWLQYLMYVLFGIVAGVTIALGNYIFTSLLFTYAFFMLMLSLNLISDFSTVMLDTRDNTIILPRPVSEATYLTARILHICTFVFGFAISFASVPFIVVLIKFNILAALVLFFNILLSSVFVVFLTHLLYLGLMKVLSGEKFKDFVTYFQILVTIVFLTAYQFLIKGISALAELNVNADQWWMILLPPGWMAGSNDVFISFHLNGLSLISMALSILVPVLGLWCVIRYLAPGFSQKLSIMDQGELRKTEAGNKEFSGPRFLARIFTRSTNESLYFILVWRIAGRDRKFKQSIYPLLGFLLVFYATMFYNTGKYIKDIDNTTFLVMLYFPLFYLYSLMINIKYSDNYKSAWLYKSVPLALPGEVISATIKAIVIKLFMPVYFICNSFLVYIKGGMFLFQVASAFVLSLICVVGMLFLFKIDMPFSVDSKNKSQNAMMLLTLSLFPLAGTLAGIHFLFIWLHFNFVIVSIAVMFLCWFFFRRLRHISWNKVEAFDA